MRHETVCYIQLRDAGVNMEGFRMGAMRKLGLSALLLLLLMTPYARVAKNFRHETKSAAARRCGLLRNSAWVEQTLKKMTLREKLGQMLMLYYFGVFTSAESAEYKESAASSRRKSRRRIHRRHRRAGRWASSAARCIPPRC